jgi:hypothetical protein
MNDMLPIALMLLLVAAAVRVAAPRRQLHPPLPRLVNMSDDAFRITDGRGRVVAVVPPSPYRAGTDHTPVGEHVVVRKRVSGEAVPVEDIPFVPGVSYLVSGPVARAAGRPDFLTDADHFSA